jgi:chromosome segregation protein
LQELEKARKLLSQDHRITSNELKELMGELEKSSKEVKKLESEVTAKVTRLSELEGAAASSLRAVSNRRDNLEKLRKDAGGLEMQRHRLEGEKEQLELQLTSAREQVSRSGQWLESIVTDVKEADFQLEDLQVGRESTAKNLGKIKTKHKTVLETIESHQKRLTGIEAQLRDESMKLASQEAAQRAREEFGGYAKGVKAVLQCRDEGKLKGIIGTIAELGRVDEEYAAAMSFSVTIDCNLAPAATSRAAAYSSSTLPSSAMVPMIPFSFPSSRHCKTALTPLAYPPNSSLALCAASWEASFMDSSRSWASIPVRRF